MTSTREIIKASLRLCRVLASGENPTADEFKDALSAYNAMLDSWSLDGLVVPVREREEFTLIPGQSSYTLGPTGDFATTRPTEIFQASVIDENSSPAFENPLDVLTASEWATISQKSLQSDLPTKLYAKGTSPLETVFIWPVPLSAKKIALYSDKPLGPVTNPNATLSLQPGHEEALRYNFAIRIAPEYGKTLSEEVIAIANESKEKIERRNNKSEVLGMDAAVLTRRPGFNIITGE